MPTPGQMAAGQQSTIPRELLEQMPQQRGAIMGAGHAMTQSDGVMAARLAELSAEVRELRAMLAPPSAVILTGAEVFGIDPCGEVAFRDAAGEHTVSAERILAGVPPVVLDRLLGGAAEPVPEGSQLKVNLLLSRLPRLRSGIDPAIAFAGTLHLGESYTELETAHAEAASGRLPTRAAGEVYCHTLTDRSILGAELAATDAQTLTYFGLHTPPATLPDAAAADEAYARVLAAIDEHLAEPLAPLVLGVEVKTPGDVEAALAMPGGHIFHGDLAWPWLDDEPVDTAAERWGVGTSHPRVLMCGSGARRGGAVSGLGGHAAAAALVEQLGLGTLDLS